MGCALNRVGAGFSRALVLSAAIPAHNLRSKLHAKNHH